MDENIRGTIEAEGRRIRGHVSTELEKAAGQAETWAKQNRAQATIIGGFAVVSLVVLLLHLAGVVGH